MASWRRLKKSQNGENDWKLKYCLVLITTLMVSQAIYEVCFRAVYPPDFGKLKLIEGTISETSTYSRKYNQPAFKLSEQQGEFVVPRNAAAEIRKLLQTGTNVKLRTSKRAVNGIWFIPSGYQQVMELNVGGYVVYNLEDYYEYRIEAQNEQAVIVTVLSILLLFTIYLIYIHPIEWQRHNKKE